MSGVVVLTGGVGGAKLVLGLGEIMPRDRITAIVNTGDDFRHLGLHVSPDIDTLLYTLSGKASREQGWGREGDSWNFLAALRELHGEDWFSLGDGDLALHVLRSARLAESVPLSSITAQFARAWGITTRVLPMSDAAVMTMVGTDEGELEFQRYFVERRCRPVVLGVTFRGAAAAAPAPGVLQAIEEADTILIAPSNPFLSIDPILAVPAIRSALGKAAAPIVAVSPIIGGKAVKGPTTKLMAELGLPANADSIVRHYSGLIDGLLLDGSDHCAADIALGRTATLMLSIEDKARVARSALALAATIARP